jgi:hypothetical protein
MGFLAPSLFVCFHGHQSETWSKEPIREDLQWTLSTTSADKRPRPRSAADARVCKCFAGIGRKHAAAQPAYAVCLAANQKAVKVKVAPIECDLEKVVQHGAAGVAAHV